MKRASFYIEGTLKSQRQYLQLRKYRKYFEFHLIHIWSLDLINFINKMFLFQRVDPEIVFTKQERIGKGSFGEVFKGIDNRTQQVDILFF